MFIAMNRFKVIKEERKAFEDLWVTRESHLDEVKGFRAFHLLRGPERDDHGRRKRILRHGPSLNNSAPPINTRASASRSHLASRNSKGSKSSRRSKPRIRPHSGCSTLGIAGRGIVWRWLDRCRHAVRPFPRSRDECRCAQESLRKPINDQGVTPPKTDRV
jgi:hypothetical protein